jgi:hypothetical protein
MLTIIKSDNGNIFGGFTEKAWNLTGNGYVDPKSFIFSMVNKENKPFKVVCTNCAIAIYCDSSYGPIFGAGRKILIASDSNSNHKSFCNFGSSFKHADYQNGKKKQFLFWLGHFVSNHSKSKYLLKKK